MNELCVFLLGVIATVVALVALVNALVSRFLAGKPWWEQLPTRAKQGIMAALGAVLGLGFWFAASQLLCENVPELRAVVELVVLAGLLDTPSAAYLLETEYRVGEGLFVKPAGWKDFVQLIVGR